MRIHPLLFVAVSAAVLAVSLPVALPGRAAADEPGNTQLAATARRAGLRVLEGEHLTLVTDRPPRAGDGVDALPRVFDEAFAEWCAHFGIDREQHRGWRAFGCLMVDRERFRVAGLLPTGGPIPDFKNGFCAGGRFWLMDQSNQAYRRHLLLHEGVHAFTLTIRESATPPWYTEGIAEYLATHRLDRDANGQPRFVPTPIPQQADDVEQLGRIEQIRALRAAHAAPALADVFQTPPAAHHDLGAYAASWAAVAFLAGHPAHAKVFTAGERGPLDTTFTQRLESAPHWDAARADRDFDAFTDELDYGYDFARSAIDWSPGEPLQGRQTIAVAGDRGWQNSGCRLATGQRCSLRAEGRVTVGQASACLLESEPDGISLAWYRGRPLGRLLAAQWMEKPADGGRPQFVVLAEGAAGECTASADGPLYFKINESPGDLADNAGRLTVTIK
ncbi:MAG: hypothetical protein NTW36_14995 [Planctomycetia bacterium]|nr:hypothetical protein [Planctomycetia bacterium]